MAETPGSGELKKEYQDNLFVSLLTYEVSKLFLDIDTQNDILFSPRNG